MPEHLNLHATEAERAELERVVEALARWPRLCHLLRYMGDKLFSGQADQLNEYNIATEVLGRSKTVFNAGEDAIARVETHRLRKRLAEFYEQEGRNHPIHLTLPTGSYVPVFLHGVTGETSPSSPNVTAASESESRTDAAAASRWDIPGWRYLALAALLILVALGTYIYLRPRASSTRAEPGNSSAPTAQSVPSEAGLLSSPVRLLAGYSGPARPDSAGRLWSADQYFSGGGSWQRSGFISRASDQFIFEYSRTGDFSYNIPLEPGSYEVHLFFSTPARSTESVSFNVAINGEYVLQGFDINADAMGEDIADERVFRGVSPGSDNLVRITFSGATGPATLNAIEILPGLAHAQLPVRLIMQTTPLTDRSDRFWHPDNYFMHGRLSSQLRPLPDSRDPDLFSGERFGHFTYAIPTDPRDRYTVVLHFVEHYFGAGSPGRGGEGSRIFKVMCNGQMLLDDFDILKEAAGLHELSKTFRHLKPSAQGKLNLTFEPVVNNATVSGIEVLDESQ